MLRPCRSPDAPSDSEQGKKLSKRAHRDVGGLPYASSISHIPCDLRTMQLFWDLFRPDATPRITSAAWQGSLE